VAELMSIISKGKINDSLTSKAENSLTITPILDNEKQIGESTIDLRLGTKFEVDMRTRKPFFDPLSDKRPIETFFQDTYRNFGEKFILYPQQLVLASTFEYVKLPNDLFGIIFTRSSWNRLGLNISSVLQSGYAGVINLELVNNSSNPIALYPGLRIVQLILFSVDGEEREAYYRNSISKYVANSDPDLSSISEDEDLQVLKNKFPINS
jgi:dCTP deaminase